MGKRITIGIIDEIKEMIYSRVTEHAKGLRYLCYADIRIEADEGRWAVAENGSEKLSGSDYGFSFGVRVLAGEGCVAPGYFGQRLGSADLDQLKGRLEEGLEHAYRRALANAEGKSTARERFGPLGEALYNASLAPIEVCQDVVPATYRVDPRTVPLDEMVRTTTEASRSVKGLDLQVKFNAVSTQTMLIRQLFCSSEGANIDQSFALTEGMLYVVAQGDRGEPQELYDYIGHQRGWEVIAQGVQEESIRFPNLMDFCLGLARDAVELSNSPPLRATDHEVVVVTNPHYNALKVHEILGHPTELDRALKMETSYAGRTWLLRSLEENQIGKPIASPLVNAFSDPSLPGYGHYRYDDEGTPARKVMHIEKGIFKGFMNSRQTAAILGELPNGSYKANDASVVPLIRMSNTVFAAGERDPQEILREVDHGYYLVGHRIPSIAESRENFRITAMKVYEIRHGQLGQLFSNGGIMADTKDYLMKVDAVGNDFQLFPIPNCGKGQPMQTKRLGNGGPTMRSRARLTGITS